MLTSIGVTRAIRYVPALVLLACSEELASDRDPSGDTAFEKGVENDKFDGGADPSKTGPGPDGENEKPRAPISTPPAPLVPEGFYPRVIKLTNGPILASVVAPQKGGRLGATVLESTDDGVTFTEVGHIDDPLASGGLCCGTLYELPRALGGLPAGALLWSASAGGDTPSRPMSIPIWRSLDRGRTWAFVSNVVTAGVPRSRGGLWEPEFSMLDDGSLVCHYSDETDPAHSQKLVAARTTDGVGWSAPRGTVVLPERGLRPGMPVIRRPPGSPFTMSYEICALPGDSCTTFMKSSNDGWSWGAESDRGRRPTTLDGSHFRHAPTITWSPTPGQNGRFYLVGQLVHGRGGQITGANGKVIFVNPEGAHHAWYPIPAPVPVPDAFDNFCPNYSSALLPLDDGAVLLEVASRWDGQKCRTYFARGPALGTGDDAGLTSGKSYRILGLMSGHCVDVAGGSTAASANVQQWTCNGGPAQDWKLERNAEGMYTARAAVSGMCLTVAGNATTPGANVEQQPCDGRAGQRWKVRNVGIDHYVFESAGGPCLDVAGGSLASGGNIHQWSCNNLAPQIWKLEAR